MFFFKRVERGCKSEKTLISKTKPSNKILDYSKSNTEEKTALSSS